MLGRVTTLVRSRISWVGRAPGRLARLASTRPVVVALSIAALAGSVAIFTRLLVADFRLQLGTVGEWLASIAIGLAAYDLLQRSHANADAARRRGLSALSQAIIQTGALDRAVRDSHAEYVGRLRTEVRKLDGYLDGTFDDPDATVVYDPLPIGLAATIWRRSFSGIDLKIAVLRSILALEHPGISWQTGFIESALGLDDAESGIQAQADLYTNDPKPGISPYALSEFADERLASVRQSIATLRSQLEKELDEVEAISMFDSVGRK